MKRIDLTGQRFGRLVAQLFLGGAVSSWLCLCDCGNQTVVAAGDLKKPLKISTKSCGCWRKERCGVTGREYPRILHRHTIGGRETPVYSLWQKASERAIKMGLPFTISVDDVHIPERCPVFGIPLISHRGEARKYWSDDSPTIDRIIPSLGYTQNNIWVISWRANRIKADASLDEIKKIIEAMKRVSGYA